MDDLGNAASYHQILTIEICLNYIISMTELGEMDSEVDRVKRRNVHTITRAQQLSRVLQEPIGIFTSPICEESFYVLRKRIAKVVQQWGSPTVSTISRTPLILSEDDRSALIAIRRLLDPSFRSATAWLARADEATVQTGISEDVPYWIYTSQAQVAEFLYLTKNYTGLLQKLQDEGQILFRPKGSRSVVHFLDPDDHARFYKLDQERRKRRTP